MSVPLRMGIVSTSVRTRKVLESAVVRMATDWRAMIGTAKVSNSYQYNPSVNCGCKQCAVLDFLSPNCLYLATSLRSSNTSN